MTAVATTPRLGVWRLEWLRLVRTPRLVALLAVYGIFGLAGPVLARYMREILQHTQSGGLVITAPPPRPADGLTQYVSQVGQTGLIVVVVMAAGALAFDARRGLSTFLRTRTASPWQLVLPRFAVTAGAAVTAYAVGTLAACYETWLLLGPLPVLPVVLGVVCTGVYLVFAVAVTAWAASVARSVIGAVGIAVVGLLVLPALGSLSAVHAWLPTRLAAAPVELVTGTGFGDYLPAIGVGVAATAALLWLATRRLARREV